MPKIPNHIIDDQIRLKLAELNEHIETLQQWHRKFMDKTKSEKLSKEEAELLKKIIEAHNNLHKQFEALSPSLVEIAKQLAEGWEPN